MDEIGVPVDWTEGLAGVDGGLDRLERKITFLYLASGVRPVCAVHVGGVVLKRLDY